MGTRSLTHILDGGKTITTIYRQFDGYPSGMGAEIKKILGKTKLTNGYGGNQKLPTTANGMGCLAAYFIGKLKQGKIGNVYIYPARSTDCGEEYVYTIFDRDGVVWLSCRTASWREYGTKKLHRSRMLAQCPLADFDPVAAEAKQEQ